MAPLSCHECGRIVSDTAKCCPSCGAQFAVPASAGTWLLRLGVLVIAGGMIGGAVVHELYNDPATKAMAVAAGAGATVLGAIICIAGRLTGD